MRALEASEKITVRNPTAVIAVMMKLGEPLSKKLCPDHHSLLLFLSHFDTNALTVSLSLTLFVHSSSLSLPASWRVVGVNSDLTVEDGLLSFSQLILSLGRESERERFIANRLLALK